MVPGVLACDKIKGQLSYNTHQQLVSLNVLVTLLRGKIYIWIRTRNKLKI